MLNPASRFAKSLTFVGRVFLTFVGLAGAMAASFGDCRPAARDLPQDYAAARAWLDGDSAYQTLDALYERYGFPPKAANVMVRYNPHPPVGILLTVPYAFLKYTTAVDVFYWSQLAALALAWVLCFELFASRVGSPTRQRGDDSIASTKPPRLRVGLPELFRDGTGALRTPPATAHGAFLHSPPVSGWMWSIAGGAWGLWAPVWQGVAWGQPVGFLMLAIVGIWRLARTDRCLGFGILLALAILVRPFVAILIATSFGWTGRQQARAVAAFLVAGVLPFIVLHIAPWDWYRAASYASGYISWCGSIPGIMDLGATGGMICFAAATGSIAALRLYGLSIDAATALALVAAMLAYPLAWYHYDTCLIPVAAWVFARVSATGTRSALWAAVAYLALRTLPDLRPSTDGNRLLDLFAYHAKEIQVLARAILLAAVARVAFRSTQTENDTSTFSEDQSPGHFPK